MFALNFLSALTKIITKRIEMRIEIKGIKLKGDKKNKIPILEIGSSLVPSRGLEPLFSAPEADVLSTEL